MCGDKGMVYANPTDAQGSPPHVRGQVLIPLSTVIIDGITPACAGTSVSALGKSPAMRDHPRMCGDKPFFSIS